MMTWTFRWDQCACGRRGAVAGTRGWTQEFSRLRIGIGRPPGRMDPAAYVLQDFSADEGPLLEETLERAVAAIETWLRQGVEVAMDQYNRRPGDGRFHS
jgi:peptidyl-tRNA hydrolase